MQVVRLTACVSFCVGLNRSRGGCLGGSALRSGPRDGDQMSRSPRPAALALVRLIVECLRASSFARSVAGPLAKVEARASRGRASGEGAERNAERPRARTLYAGWRHSVCPAREALVRWECGKSLVLSDQSVRQQIPGILKIVRGGRRAVVADMDMDGPDRAAPRVLHEVEGLATGDNKTRKRVIVACDQSLQGESDVPLKLDGRPELNISLSRQGAVASDGLRVVPLADET